MSRPSRYELLCSFQGLPAFTKSGARAWRRSPPVRRFKDAAARSRWEIRNMSAAARRELNADWERVAASAGGARL